MFCTCRLGDGRAARFVPIAHSSPEGDLLRATICDDELIQSIGRGRGINRGPQDPLEVHVLADVALLLVHDEVTTWELSAPDLFQKMLLAGVAVDSPADATMLHPELFAGEKQAQKAFERSGLKRQTSYKDPIREMSLKSAAYRRAGRGRGWQRAWWVQGDSSDVEHLLKAHLGVLEAWRPE